MKPDEVTLKLSEVDEASQQAVLMTMPKILKVMVKRLGGKVTIRASELDALDDQRLAIGKNPTTKKMRVELVRREKEPIQ